ncbi:hypothetical protein HPB48_018240 [Haemaphysalis longicornis]|uniref:PH domain-containing protein n=1 Tax=Haemaphysalis longicornis TaxID=44386 RepID=A0A9J6FEG4_HAELO|nr:hypothetical protein HPB48_018240 [Haemaphysalis longicornis]
MAAAFAASRTGSARPGRAPWPVPGARWASLNPTEQPVRRDVMSSIGSVKPSNSVLPESCIEATDNGVANGECCVALQSQDVSATAPTDVPSTEPTIVKKDLLWQKRDKFFSRWKERFFVLTKDYLACFKKESMIGTSKMGRFVRKVNLADVEGVQWGEKKRHGVIVLRLGTKDQLLLRTSGDLYGWMIALRDTISRSKKRREARRNPQMISQQMCDAEMPKRQSLARHQKSTSTDPQRLSFPTHAFTSFKFAPLGKRAPVPTSVDSTTHKLSYMRHGLSDRRPGTRRSTHGRSHCEYYSPCFDGKPFPQTGK